MYKVMGKGKGEEEGGEFNKEPAVDVVCPFKYAWAVYAPLIGK